MNNQTEKELREIIIKTGKDIKKELLNGTNMSFDTNSLERTFKIYKKLNPQIKEKMNLKNEKNDADKIDRHKIASILLVAIINSNPFFNNLEHIDEYNYLQKNAKYILAIKVAMTTMHFFDKRKDYSKILESDYINKDFVKLISVNKKLSDKICETGEDIEILFFYSHIFYMIEKCL